MINACSSGKFENGFLAKMWRYISGVSKVVEEEKNEKKPKATRYSKEYEKKRTRTFSVKWQVSRPRLQYDHDKMQSLAGF